MHVDYTKICRVCMSSATRDIFVRSMENGNPLERLLEKLRYVTMMKIEENDDLPRLLCDLCIVQLNVSYNFKRQAIENDTKLRQYFIENGITSTLPSSTNINEHVSSNRNIINESSPSSIHSSVTNSNISPVQSQQKKNNIPIRPIIPIIIKEEPGEEDVIFTSAISPVPSATTSTVVSSKKIPNKNSGMVYLNSLAPIGDVNYYQNVNSGTTSTKSFNINRPEPNSSNDTIKQNGEKKIYSKTDQMKTHLSNRIKEIAEKRVKNISNMRKQISNRIAEKRVNNLLKTKRVLPENIKKSTLEIRKLSINMVPPMGKQSRKEMKQNIDYGLKKKSPTTSFHRGSSVSNSNNKTSTTKMNTKNSIIVSEQLINPFNKGNNIKKKPKSYVKRSQGPKSKLLKPKIEPDADKLN